MSLTLPLFRRPGAIVLLDDETDYLETLAMVIPASWQIALYSRPSAFLRHMSQEPTRWESDAMLQLQMIDQWRKGQALLPQVLRYWASQPDRYRLTQTCVVDYAMPGTDGLTVLNTLLDWPGSRVLLTGQADEQIAIQAFNQGLIDQFIPKQTAQITRHLLGVLQRIAHTPHPRLNTIWRGALTPSQLSLLKMPSAAQWLSDYSLNHWVEHVVLGDPFGLLGVDGQGQVHWMQLEPSHSLGELAELAASAGLSGSVIQSIRQGERLAAVELHQQLGLVGDVRTAPAMDIGTDKLLVGALFSLDSNTDLPRPIKSYRQYLRDECERTVLDA